MTMTYRHLVNAIKTNPAVAAAHSYWQDDGFGTLIDTITMCCNDRNRTCYLYAFIEREYEVIHNPIFYSSH